MDQNHHLMEIKSGHRMGVPTTQALRDMTESKRMQLARDMTESKRMALGSKAAILLNSEPPSELARNMIQKPDGKGKPPLKPTNTTIHKFENGSIVQRDSRQGERPYVEKENKPTGTRNNMVGSRSMNNV